VPESFDSEFCGSLASAHIYRHGSDLLGRPRIVILYSLKESKLSLLSAVSLVKMKS
jgi:hypothetical protein